MDFQEEDDCDIETDPERLRDCIMNDVEAFLGRPVGASEEEVADRFLVSADRVRTYGDGEVQGEPDPEAPLEPNTGAWQASSSFYTGRVAHGRGYTAEEQAQMAALPPPPTARPPPPPPPPPVPVQALQSRGGDAWQNSQGLPMAAPVHAVVEALEALIRSKDGALPGTAFEELYNQDYSFKVAVRGFGGPKKFVDHHRDHFVWVSEGVPGGSVKLVKQADSEEAHQQSSAEPAPVEETQDYWKGSGWSSYGTSDRGQYGKSYHQREDCPELLEKLVRWNGGILEANRVYSDFKNWKPWLVEAFNEDIESAGGIKNFVSAYPDRFQWVPGPPQKEAIRLVSGGNKLDEFLEVLQHLIRWHGGTLLASRIFIELRSWKPSAYDSFRREVEHAGGLKKFAARHPECFIWVSDGNPGKDALQLVPEGEKAKSHLDALAEVIRWHGGTLLASKLLAEMKLWNPEENEYFNRAVQEAGGLKKFFLRYPERFEWVVGTGPGVEAVRVVQAGSAPQRSLAPEEYTREEDDLSHYQ